MAKGSRSVWVLGDGWAQPCARAGRWVQCKVMSLRILMWEYILLKQEVGSNSMEHKDCTYNSLQKQNLYGLI